MFVPLLGVCVRVDVVMGIFADVVTHVLLTAAIFVLVCSCAENQKPFVDHS